MADKELKGHKELKKELKKTQGSENSRVKKTQGSGLKKTQGSGLAKPH
jgi:hypothetical protein